MLKKSKKYFVKFVIQNQRQVPELLSNFFIAHFDIGDW